MTELIFEELPARENENRFVVGFRMCKRKNWKYRYVMLYHITNPAHEEYGNWIIILKDMIMNILNSKKKENKE